MITLKLKHGTTREDGMMFVCYQSNGTEYWVTPEAFEARRQKTLERAKKKRAENPEVFRAAYNQWRLENPEKYKESKARHRAANLERIREEDRIRSANRRKNQAEKIREQDRKRYGENPEKFLVKNKQWATNNREIVNAINRAKFKRYRATNPLFALSSRLRARLHHFLNEKGFKKQTPTQDIIGCDWETLKAHIESKFTNKMTWENRHLWVIDHIIPLASATSEEEVYRLCHYSNLQPLWEEVNNAKGDLMPDEWSAIAPKYADYLPPCLSQP